ncbi:MAG: hypothetical protein M5R38_15555 [Candidatus Methylomirabilis sp.]|nr:hypothetical protein [Candidatus Methylomirabilis sp.]
MSERSEKDRRWKMAGEKVPVKSVKKVGSLLSELLEIERRIADRAHEPVQGAWVPGRSRV